VRAFTVVPGLFRPELVTSPLPLWGRCSPVGAAPREPVPGALDALADRRHERSSDLAA
jgi:hypothetical protein